MADKTIKNVKINVDFEESSTRENIKSGESVNTLFGKVKKWFADLKPVAFSGSYNDLEDQPESLPANGGKADNVEWSGIENKPFTDGVSYELKDAPDDVKEEYGFLDDEVASVAGMNGYPFLVVKLSDSSNNVYENIGKIIYVGEGKTYSSYTAYGSGATIPSGEVPKGYYKLGTQYSGFIIGQTETNSDSTEINYTNYYFGETYTVGTKNNFSGNADSATTSDSLTVGTVGTSTQPVYFSNGIPTKISYTLGTASQKSYTDSSSASAFGTGTNLTTERDVYYGTPKINNSKSYTSSTTIYAPTTGGTSGYLLKANGEKNTPTWINVDTLLEDKIVQSDWNQADSTAKDYIKNRPIEEYAVSKEAEEIYSGYFYSIDDSTYGQSSDNGGDFYINDLGISYNEGYEYEFCIDSSLSDDVGYLSDEVIDTNIKLDFKEGIDGYEALYYQNTDFQITIIFLYIYDEIDILPKYEYTVPVAGNLLDGKKIYIKFQRRKKIPIISEDYLPESVKNVNVLPSVTSDDNGKILKVVDGVWTAVTL